MLEKCIELKLKNFLKSKNIWFLKTHGGYFQSSGICDLIVCYKGLFYAIELKVWPNKLTEIQRLNLLKQRNCGARIFIIDQYNVDELIKEWENEKRIIQLSRESVRKYINQKPIVTGSRYGVR